MLSSAEMNPSHLLRAGLTRFAQLCSNASHSTTTNSNSNKKSFLFVFRYIDAKELKTTFGEIGMKISDKDVCEMMKEVGVQVSANSLIESRDNITLNHCGKMMHHTGTKPVSGRFRHQYRDPRF